MREQGHVRAAAAQRRHLDADRVEAVHEVLAEAAVLGQVGERPVGRRDDADVHAARGRLADALDLAGLEHAQQGRLELGREVADLVEEDGAAVGGLEEALLVGRRARERAADVAEELGFEQVVRERAAEERHERAVGARAVVVEAAGDELLARAGLALDEDRDVGVEDAVERLEEGVHGRRAADHLAEAVAAPAPRGAGGRSPRAGRPRGGHARRRWRPGPRRRAGTAGARA